MRPRLRGWPAFSVARVTRSDAAAASGALARRVGEGNAATRGQRPQQHPLKDTAGDLSELNENRNLM